MNEQHQPADNVLKKSKEMNTTLIQDNNTNTRMDSIIHGDGESVESIQTTEENCSNQITGEKIGDRNEYQKQNDADKYVPISSSDNEFEVTDSADSLIEQMNDSIIQYDNSPIEITQSETEKERLITVQQDEQTIVSSSSSDNTSVVSNDQYTYDTDVESTDQNKSEEAQRSSTNEMDDKIIQENIEDFVRKRTAENEISVFGKPSATATRKLVESTKRTSKESTTPQLAHKANTSIPPEISREVEIPRQASCIQKFNCNVTSFLEVSTRIPGEKIENITFGTHLVYDVSFQDGPVGLTLGTCKNTSPNGIYVNAFYGEHSPAERSEAIQLGDMVLSIAAPTVNRWFRCNDSLEDATNFIKKNPRPIILRFWRPSIPISFDDIVQDTEKVAAFQKFVFFSPSTLVRLTEEYKPKIEQYLEGHVFYTRAKSDRLKVEELRLEWDPSFLAHCQMQFLAKYASFKSGLLRGRTTVECEREFHMLLREFFDHKSRFSVIIPSISSPIGKHDPLLTDIEKKLNNIEFEGTELKRNDLMIKDMDHIYNTFFVRYEKVFPIFLRSKEGGEMLTASGFPSYDVLSWGASYLVPFDELVKHMVWKTSFLTFLVQEKKYAHGRLLFRIIDLHKELDKIEYNSNEKFLLLLQQLIRISESWILLQTQEDSSQRASPTEKVFSFHSFLSEHCHRLTALGFPTVQSPKQLLVMYEILRDISFKTTLINESKTHLQTIEESLRLWIRDKGFLLKFCSMDKRGESISRQFSRMIQHASPVKVDNPLSDFHARIPDGTKLHQGNIHDHQESNLFAGLIQNKTLRKHVTLNYAIRFKVCIDSANASEKPKLMQLHYESENVKGALSDDFIQSLMLFAVPFGVDTSNTPLLFNFLMFGSKKRLYGVSLLSQQSIEDTKTYYTGIVGLSDLPLFNSMRMLLKNESLKLCSANEEEKSWNLLECDMVELLKANLLDFFGPVNGFDEMISLSKHIPRNLFVSQPLFVDLPLKCIFDVLDRENILYLFQCMLLEKKILLISKRYSLLTYVAEILRLMISPLEWKHVYIPVLPKQLLDSLECPTPFIIGIHESYAFKKDFPYVVDVTIVNLDTSTVTLPACEMEVSETKTIYFPKFQELSDNLVESINPEVNFMDSIIEYQRDPLQWNNVIALFTQTVSDILKEIRPFTTNVVRQGTLNYTVIDEEALLEHVAGSKNNEYEFYQHFLQTQMISSYFGHE